MMAIKSPYSRAQIYDSYYDERLPANVSSCIPEAYAVGTAFCAL